MNIRTGIIPIALAFIAFFSTAFAQEELPPPFVLNGGYLSIAPASFYTPDVKGQDLHYTLSTLAFGYTQPLCSTFGLIFGTEYAGALLKWSENPEFNENRFAYVTFSLGAYTIALEDWFWALSFAANLDTEKFDLRDYTLYDGVLYGRYTFCDWIDIYAGVIVQVGLHKEKVWPMAGFTYIPWDNWRLSAVFPTDMSLTYTVCDWLYGAGSFRFLRTRHRLQDNELNPQGIFEYQVIGFELDLGAYPWHGFEVKGYVGHTFNGDLKVTNKNNHQARHYKFKGAPYAGFSAVMNF